MSPKGEKRLIVMYVVVTHSIVGKGFGKLINNFFFIEFTRNNNEVEVEKSTVEKRQTPDRFWW